MPDEILGLTLCDKLLGFDKNMPSHPPGHTNKYWAALVASGAKSAREFETKSVYVYVRTVKSAIRRAIQASKALREAGLV